MSEAENDAAWVAKLIITERDATITALREEVERLTRAYNDLVALERKAGENIAIGTEIELAEKDAALTALRQRVVAVGEQFVECVSEDNEDQPDDTKCEIKAGRSTIYCINLGHFRALATLVHEIKETTK